GRELSCCGIGCCLGRELSCCGIGCCIVVYDDDELEDPSKQGRSIIEKIDQDAEVYLVTPTQVNTQGEAQSQESQPKNQRRRTISTANGGISTAEESVSTDGASMPVSTAGIVDK
nr:hypothetical protein [Tanacetum cinerariifolium]